MQPFFPPMTPALHISKVYFPALQFLSPVPHKIVAMKNLIQYVHRYLGSMASWRRVTVKLTKTRLSNQDWLPWQSPAHKRCRWAKMEEVKSLQVLGIEPFLEPVLATEPPSITVQPYQGFILRNCQVGRKVDG